MIVILSFPIVVEIDCKQVFIVFLSLWLWKDIFSHFYGWSALKFLFKIIHIYIVRKHKKNYQHLVFRNNQKRKILFYIRNTACGSNDLITEVVIFAEDSKSSTL